MSPRSGTPSQMRPSMKREVDREGIAAVAVAELGDEQIVADQQRRLHRAGRDVERVVEEGAEDQRDQQRLR